jgi:hypothetical protein
VKWLVALAALATLGGCDRILGVDAPVSAPQTVSFDNFEIVTADCQP